MELTKTERVNVFIINILIVSHNYIYKLDLNNYNSGRFLGDVHQIQFYSVMLFLSSRALKIFILSFLYI